MNANSAEDWQIALTWRKTMQILVEIVACAICPLPIPYEVYVLTPNYPNNLNYLFEGKSALSIPMAKPFP